MKFLLPTEELSKYFNDGSSIGIKYVCCRYEKCRTASKFHNDFKKSKTSLMTDKCTIKINVSSTKHFCEKYEH